MTRRGWIIVLVLACLALGWWWSRPNDPHPPPEPVAGTATPSGSIQAVDCPLPPRVQRGEAPLQTAVPADVTRFVHADARLQPLAGFSLHARVLGSEPYRLDREARFAPLDLALGWGRMADDDVLARLQIRQGGRWYRYSWRGEPPIPRGEIARSSANMHMIPADDGVAKALARVGRDERVRIEGWLVEVQADDGWRWRSSLTRDDEGQGACEVVYVCAVTRL